jgi:multiple sugar transport system substrate-binding protein
MNAMEAVAAAFGEEQENLQVNPLVPSPSMDEKLLTAIAGGEPPDVAVGNIAFSQFCARGSFTPLDDLFEASEIVPLGSDDIIASLWEDGSWQGAIYGLAGGEVGPRMGFVYNVDLVEQAGFDPDTPPLTWDELYEWHEKITTLDDAGNVEILGFDPLDAMGGRRPTSDASFFWADSFGFEWWDANEMSFNFDDELFVQSLVTIKRFYDLVGVEKMEGYRTSYGTWTQSPTASFPAGVQAAILNGYWTPGELIHSAPDLEFRHTWPPNSSERRGVKFQNVGGHPVVIPKGVAQPEESFKFLEFMTTPTCMDIILDTTGWFGPRISWLQTVDPSKFPGLDFYLKSTTEADELKPCPLCPISSFVGQELSNTWDAVNYGEKTPEEAAADLQDLLTEEIGKQFPTLVG